MVSKFKFSRWSMCALNLMTSDFATQNFPDPHGERYDFTTSISLILKVKYPTSLHRILPWFAWWKILIHYTELPWSAEWKIRLHYSVLLWSVRRKIKLHYTVLPWSARSKIYLHCTVLLLSARGKIRLQNTILPWSARWKIQHQTIFNLLFKDYFS